MMQTRDSSRRRWIGQAGLLALSGVLLLASATPGWTQPLAPSAPPPDAPLADPILDADALLAATQAAAWIEGDARWVLLKGDGRFGVGAYGFQFSQAVARVETQWVDHQRVRQIAVYMRDVKPLGGGAVQARGDVMLVTASTRGDVELQSDLLSRLEAAPDDELVARARARIARHYNRLHANLLDAPADPLISDETAALRAEREALVEAAHRLERVELEPTSTEALVPEREPARPTSILPTRGQVNYAFDRIVVDRTDAGASVMLIGNVRVFYQDYDTDRAMTLKAEKAVIFVNGAGGETGDLEGGLASASTVEGIYLEDNVIATDGTYTIRAPRVYYDVEQNKAVLLEAVLYSWDARRELPLYVRAETLRQHSASSFSADRARLTTSEFGEPHFAIGAKRINIKQIARKDGTTTTGFNAKDVTFRWYDVPVGYLPYAAGKQGQTALKGVGGGYSSKRGVVATTKWDLFALAGVENAENMSLEGRLDWQGDHQLAAGADYLYDLEEMTGRARGYIVPLDSGKDQIGGRRDIEFDNDFRGFGRWEHRQYLMDDWELQLDVAAVSDPSFLEEFFRGEATNAREYQTAAYLLKQEEDWGFDAEIRYDLTDFTPQLTTLQAPGFHLDKVAELGYRRSGTSLWEDRLTLHSSNTIGRIRANFGDDSPSDRGFNNTNSQRLFGLAPDDPFSDSPLAQQFPDDFVTRFDTRQEISSPLVLGGWSVVPYGVGRFTAYDTDFADQGGTGDQIRLWGSAGVRTHTTFHREWAGVSSQVLNVRGVRHLIEPSIDGSWAATSIDATDLPAFERDVEALAQGGTLRLGLTNTLETQRGGPGLWRTVEWVRLKTDVVLREDEEDESAPLPYYIEYQPEFSTGGDHFYSELLWMVSDTLGVAGDLTYAFDSSEVAQWRLGATLDHTDRLTSFLSYEEVQALESRLLRWGFNYELTTKYRLAFSQVIDFEGNESRSLNFSLTRKLPRWVMRVDVAFDQLEDEQAVALLLAPEGLANEIRPFQLFSTRGDD